MIEILIYLTIALSLTAPFVSRVDARYIAIAAAAMLAFTSVYSQTPVGLLIAVAALAMALDRPTGAFGLPLAFAALSTVLAVYVYYTAAPPIYGVAALALVTAAVYGMLAMGKNRENVEGAVKYVVFSGVGKALIVVGYVLSQTGVPQGLYVVVLGFMFELGVAPFHAWVVEAYALSSPRGAAALALFSKTTALFVLLSIFRSVPGDSQVGLVALAVALASMFVANIAGLTAKTLGRIMAYSSIAHMSYALAAVALVWWLGERPLSLLGIQLNTLHAAALVVVLEALASGLAKAGVFGYLTTRNSDVSPPRRSLLNMLNIFSLLGLPPLLGFWPKLFLILLILAYPPTSLITFLVVWVVLNSALATPYYLRAFRFITEAPGPAVDNATVSYTAFISTALGLLIPVVYLYL
ncbi:MAG: proton-conducting transporter membrane subunit [Pyrobaculum sp.]